MKKGLVVAGVGVLSVKEGPRGFRGDLRRDGSLLVPAGALGQGTGSKSFKSVSAFAAHVRKKPTSGYGYVLYHKDGGPSSVSLKAIRERVVH